MSTSRFEKFMQKSSKNGIRNVALDYAYKGDTITFSVLSEKYGISKKVIQDCVEYAIVNCLIDYDEVILIKEKSHRNQAIHFRNTPVRTQSDRYYEDLLKRRLNYVKHLEDMQKANVFTSALKDEARKQLRKIDSHLDQLLSQFQDYQDYVSSEDAAEGYSSYDEFDYKIMKLKQEREKLLRYLN